MKIKEAITKGLSKHTVIYVESFQRKLYCSISTTRTISIKAREGSAAFRIIRSSK